MPRRARKPFTLPLESLEPRLFLSRDYYVDANSPALTPTGVSWSDAYQDLQQALTLASPGDRILVADGTYKPTSTKDRTISFILKNSVQLLGGHAGYGATDPHARDITLYPSILSGNIGNPDTNTDNSYHVLIGSGTYSTALLDGFTITAGNANGSNAATGSGGGMYNAAGNPTLRNCTFTANSARYGGAISNSSARPTLRNCIFTLNSATYGGAIHNEYSGPAMTNCVFIGNAVNASSGYGGAIYNQSSVPKLINCTLVGNAVNASFGYGGAIYNTHDGLGGYSQPVLTNCIVWANVATSAPQIYLSTGSSVTVTYSDIQSDTVFEGTKNINADPLFRRNPSAGADGKWGTPDDDFGDLRLRPISPCVDTGINSALPIGVTTDLAGNPRLQDVPTGGASASPVIDMGAYEIIPTVDADFGKPCFVAQGQSVTLHALATGSVAGPLQYAWEWTGDNQFDDATGPNPLFSAVGSPVGTVTVSLRITDAASQFAVFTTTVNVIPNIYYVDADATGANDGTSWENAYTSLVAALNATMPGIPGQQIRVAGGTYKPTTTTDRTASFQLQNGVSLFGGYAGYGAPDPNARDTISYRSVLSGDIGTPGVNSDNSYHVVNVSGVDQTAVLDGFTIAFGRANGADTNGYGGGVFVSSANPTIRNCIFNGNRAIHGAGVYASASSLTLAGCVFSGNEASYGAGVYGSMALVNCTFSMNAAIMGSDVYATYAWLTNCIVWGQRQSTGFVNIPIYSPGGASVSYSDIENGFAGSGNIQADPLFVRNPTLGPDGILGTPDDDYGDLRLQACSPVVDAGQNSAVPSGMLTDAAGRNRFQDLPTISDTGLGSAPVVDMGAFEAVPALAANAGGPYRVVRGQSLNLHGLGASSIAGPLQYGWDWDSDGEFDDATGPNPTFNAAALSPGAIPVKLRVTDSTSISTVTSATITVLPDILYVDAKATGANDGTSWANAYTSLTTALTVAATSPPGQQIRVAGGTYKPTTNANRSAFFELMGNVDLFGGYAGYGAAEPDDRNLSLYPSILSGDIGTIGSSADNCYSVVLVRGSATLDGFTITGGNADLSRALDRGGGVYVNAGMPIICNCLFTGNYAIAGGGMAAKSGSSPIVMDCAFTGNSAITGGGVYNESNASTTLTNCTFNGNRASDRGGGVYNYFCSPTLTACIFNWNSATYGGGMGNSAEASPVLANCTFTGNSASTYGGGMYNDYSSPVLNNCAFIGNSASSTGGGICNRVSSMPKLTNCTFSGNANRAITNYDSSSPTLTNCILWSSGGPIDAPIFNYHGTAIVTCSLIQGGYEGPGNLDADPQFLRNPSPGPDTKWGTADDDYGDLRLRLTSPALDAGDNAALPSTLTTDLAGNPRFFDIPTISDTGLGTAPLVDLGAYEAQRLPLSLPTTDSSDTYHVNFSLDRLVLNIWTTSPLTSPPNYSRPVDYLSSLDLTAFTAADSLLIHNTSLAQVESWLKTCYLSTASASPHTTLAPFPQPDGSILIKLALYGDTNNDGQVNLSDYFTIDSGYLNQRQGFTNGDANLDGEINLNDYFLIDSAYLNQQPPLASSSSSTRTKQVLKALKKKPKTKPTFSSKRRIH